MSPSQDSDPAPASEVVPLHAAGQSLLADAHAARARRAARTVVSVPGLRTTLLALVAGCELAEHDAPGAATLGCLTGRVRLATTDREWVLDEHDLIPIPDQRHRLIADTDSVVLLTVRLG
ncbi:LuxR family transcriptional regulator [Streptomyces sp. NPDC057429]|uniref:LuxR family transcriptional regulator n=1 Tax=Streptomyces sp. NPDC057429 TaxID=3346130 RepID=UPI0036C65FE4